MTQLSEGIRVIESIFLLLFKQWTVNYKLASVNLSTPLKESPVKTTHSGNKFKAVERDDRYAWIGFVNARFSFVDTFPPTLLLTDRSGKS